MSGKFDQEFSPSQSTKHQFMQNIQFHLLPSWAPRRGQQIFEQLSFFSDDRLLFRYICPVTPFHLTTRVQSKMIDK